MKINELSKEDQELLNIDFGSELEKQASENAQEIHELIDMGMNKMAEAAADEMDKEKEEEKEEEEEEKEELDEEQTKEAAVKGAIIADAYIEGLMKIGSERHGDELYYLYPALEEAIEKIASKAKVGKGIVDTVVGGAKKLYNTTKKEINTAMKEAPKKGTPKKQVAKFEDAQSKARKNLALKGAGALGVAGLGGIGTYKALKD